MNTESFKRDLGGFIFKVRKSTGLSQVDVAARMNINPQNVSDYELGKFSPTLAWMVRLCIALEKEPKPFFSEMVDELGEHFEGDGDFSLINRKNTTACH